MSKKLIWIITGVIILLNGCQSGQKQVEYVEPCQMSGLSGINALTYESVGQEVTICGTVSTWDYDDHFVIEDQTGGIYVYSDIKLQNAQNLVNTVIKVTGIVDIYKDSLQIVLKEPENLTQLDNVNNRLNPKIVYDFSNLDIYIGQLITLKNVNIGPENYYKNVIFDQQDKIVGTIYFGDGIKEIKHVDITGVYYPRSNRENMVIINDRLDIVSTNHLSEMDLLEEIKESLEIPSVISQDTYLPTKIHDAVVEWESSINQIRIYQGYVESSITERTEIVLTAILYTQSSSEQKTFKVNYDPKSNYEVIEFTYNGPQFQEDSLKQTDRGSSQYATLDRCHDGDTARFIVNGNYETVRFLSIDTEELYHPIQKEEEWGKPASEYTCNQLENASEIIL